MKLSTILFVLLCLVPTAYGLTFAVLNDAYDSFPGTPTNLTTADPKVGNFSGNFSSANLSWVDLRGKNPYGIVGRNFTFAFWVNFNAVPSTDQVIYGTETQLAISTASPGIIRFTIASGTPCVGRSVQTQSGALFPNTWYHVAVTAGGGVEDPFISLNGTKHQQSGIFVNPLCQPSTLNSTMGKAVDSNGSYLNGRLDDFRIWDRALTNSEIYSLAINGTIPSSTNLKAYYDFEGNFTEPIPPGAPVLSYVLDADGQGAVLSWTIPIGQISSYTLTRGLTGARSYTFPNTTTSYHVNLLPTASTFTVRANGPIVNGPESNLITLTATDRKLFGDNGSLTSGVTGQEFSYGWFGTTAYVSAAFVTLGILFVAIITIGVGELMGPVGGLGFGFAACWLCYLFNWWPLWLLIFMCVATFAAVVLFAGFRTRRDSR